MRYAMIMAGGAGTRLWPMSRNARPKQLLPLITRPGSKQPLSLLKIAAERVEGLIPVDRRYICTSEQFRAAIRAELPEFKDQQILGEPMGRDTVNAVGLAAAVFAKLHKDAVFVVLTADHLIEPREKFQNLVDLAFRLVEQDRDRLITFSIKPTYPATGFGYVERSSEIILSSEIKDSRGKAFPGGLAYRVERFVEKPDLHRAQAYVESGHFGWNSGMFVFSAQTFLEALKKYKPESHSGLMKIQKAWGTKNQKMVLEEVYPTLPRISVDYAVMEPASKEHRVCTVLADVKWLDVGSWPSFGETLEPDADGNRIAPSSNVRTITVDSRNNLIVSESSDSSPTHTIAVLGVKDLIVVHTPDATLIMPRDKAEQLKKLHALVGDELK